MWNIACDGAINPDLVAAGFTLPAGAVMDSKWRGMCAEEIYRELEKNPPPQSVRMAADFGRVMDACNPSDTAGMAKAEVEAELAVRHAAMMARAMGIGTLPKSVEEMIGNVNRQVRNWREILRDFIDSRSRGDYSWARPNKRMLGMGYVLPGLVPDQLGHLIIAVDTSGSISETALKAFAAEAKAAFDEGCADRVTVVYCDCNIQRVEEYAQGDEMKLTAKGGGGTDFAPVMEWVTEHASDAAALVYFTDMECNSWGEQPPMPVLWASYGSSRRYKAPFGTVVAVDEHG
jgi:predicted metal-dependent peptidase